jgi:hypothetical protein
MSLIQVVHVNKTLQEDSSHLRAFEGITCRAGTYFDAVQK